MTHFALLLGYGASAVLAELVLLAGFLFIGPVAGLLDQAPPALPAAAVALAAGPAVLLADGMAKWWWRSRRS